MSAHAGWIGPRRSTARSRALDDDVRAELESHIELATDELVEAGETPERARAVAERRFGDIDAIAGRCLAEKTRGEITVKTLVVLLVAGLFLMAAAFAFTTVQARRVAVEREMMARVAAERLAVESAEREPILLGAADIAKPGDTIQLTTASDAAPEIVSKVRVDAGGMVLLPEVGRVLVTDKTRLELEQFLNAAYDQYYADLPHVYVILERNARD